MAIVTVIQAILAKLATDEIKAWLPIISQNNLKCAVSFLPAEMRSRYMEEWEAHLQEKPGDLGKLFSSAGQILAALRMAGIYRREAKPSALQAIKQSIAVRERNIAGRLHMTSLCLLWFAMSEGQGLRAGDKATLQRHPRYPRFAWILTADGECPLWRTCLVSAYVFLHPLSWRWLQSANRRSL